MRHLLTSEGSGLTRRLGVALAVAFLAVATLSGGAYAYFKTTGSGTGAATIGSLPDGSVTLLAAASTPTGTPLIPGGTAQLVFTITNNNAFSVTLFSIQSTAAGTADHGNIGTCATSGVSVPLNTPSGVTLTPGTHDYSINGAAQMGTTASGSPSDSGCQGATFHIPVRIVVHK